MYNNNINKPDRVFKADINGIPELIDLCLNSKNNLLIVGDPGTGKSTIIKNMEQQGYKVTMLTGSSTYEETVNGIPYRDSENKSTSGNDLSVYNVPAWLEDVAHYKEKQILFIDEFNTAEPQVLKTFLSILTERKVPTQPEDLAIPENCVLVAAMNPANQNDGEQLIRPLKSRFMMVKITSTQDGYKKYVTENCKFDNIPTENVEALVDSLDRDMWGVETSYSETNPRSVTNFLRALDKGIESGKDAKTICPQYSLAFFGQAIAYPTDETIAAQAEAKKQIKNPYPTYDELEQMETDELNNLFNQLKTKFTTKADKVCLDIKKVLSTR